MTEAVRITVLSIMTGTIIPKYGELLSGRMNMGDAKIVSQNQDAYTVQVPIFSVEGQPSMLSYVGGRRCRLNVKYVLLHFTRGQKDHSFTDHEVFYSELASDNER